jgi:hypothetical protein
MPPPVLLPLVKLGQPIRGGVRQEKRQRVKGAQQVGKKKRGREREKAEKREGRRQA